MHNKFLVFANYEEEPRAGEHGSWVETVIKPYGVWTGSFNLTQNAERSFENAVYMTNKAIVRAYFEEFSQIMALSEPLDWSKDWMEPEWRIGT